MAHAGTVSVKVVPDVDDFLKELERTVPTSVVMQIMQRAAHDLLFQYSEWLDSNGIIRSEKQSRDDRSHDQLVRDFLAKD